MTLKIKSSKNKLSSSTENTRRGQHSKYLPFAFTEQGVAMLSSVLRSERAVAVNIKIMRVFVKMRQMITEYKELVKKIEALETSQAKSDKNIDHIYRIIKELLEPEYKTRKPIVFVK